MNNNVWKNSLKKRKKGKRNTGNTKGKMVRDDEKFGSKHFIIHTTNTLKQGKHMR
jgi:hypothetical protein